MYHRKCIVIVSAHPFGYGVSNRQSLCEILGFHSDDDDDVLGFDSV